MHYKTPNLDAAQLIREEKQVRGRPSWLHLASVFSPLPQTLLPTEQSHPAYLPLPPIMSDRKAMQPKISPLLLNGITVHFIWAYQPLSLSHALDNSLIMRSRKIRNWVPDSGYEVLQSWVWIRPLGPELAVSLLSACPYSLWRKAVCTNWSEPSFLLS